ncbi:hypothetical protein C8F04DRAFT_1107222 [Mycena alexandri]|uniref:F-box domain-containing protein n=1 Tax=Mycena alexandri TaxID=1745969 RepID=A0AAD6X573_9AGAR|nr:hypothetical protein C8F04DRAFT_1107222 [Mycena alexandri]
MALTGITDLPTEILVKILENPEVPTESLYSLALLCRPLQICLFVSSMDRITCILPHPSSASISPEWKTFISRLSSVKEISLDLDTTGQSLVFSRAPDDVLHAWASQFGDLLNSVVASGCHALTILNGHHLVEAYELDLPGLSPSFIQNWAKKVSPSRNSICGFRRVPRLGKDAHVCTYIPRGLRPHSQLTSFNIDSTTLIVPPGLTYTLAAMRASPITSLTLSISILRVSAEIWRAVLPLIGAAVPGLTTLSLTHVDPSGAQTDVVKFLTRLPLLTDLSITSAGGLVDHLLSGWDCCPNILSVHILWRATLYFQLPFLLTHMSSIIRKLIARGLSPYLAFHVTIPTGIAEDAFVIQNSKDSRLASLRRINSLSVEGEVSRTSRSPSTEGPSRNSVLVIVRKLYAVESLKTVEVDGEMFTV